MQGLPRAAPQVSQRAAQRQGHVQVPTALREPGAPGHPEPQKVQELEPSSRGLRERARVLTAALEQPVSVRLA